MFKEKMGKLKYNLGGEQSGHIILGDKATTGDGILVALEVLFILKRLNKKPSKALNLFKPVSQILLNLNVKDKEILKHKIIQKTIKLSEKKISKHGRILVRKSGTESIIRIMGESNNLDLLKGTIINIQNIINKYS